MNWWRRESGDSKQRINLLFALPYLIFLLIPLGQIYSAGFDSWRHWVLVALIIALGVTYTATWMINQTAPTGGRAQPGLLVVVAMAGLVLLGMVVGAVEFPGLLFFCSFIASPWALQAPQRYVAPGLLAILLFTAALGVLFSSPLWALLMSLVITLLAGASCWISRYSIVRQRQLDVVREQQHHSERERQRTQIGADLHDVLGQDLTGLAIKAELADKLLAAGRIDEAQIQLRDLAGLSRQVLTDVRAVVSANRGWSIERELAIASDLLTAAEVSLHVTGGSNEFLEPQASVMARIIREAVTNILNHSRAANCWIVLTAHSLSIENDGYSLARARKTAGSQHGLIGLQESVEDIGDLRWEGADSRWNVTFEVTR